MTDPLKPHHGYSAGHPWYYVLGGDIPRIKQIRDHAAFRSFRGYLAEDIETANKLPEPKRTETIEALRSSVNKALQDDISRYRRAAQELRAFRDCDGAKITELICVDIHVALSLKFNHLFNDFAHLHYLDSLPKQLDLFAV